MFVIVGPLVNVATHAGLMACESFPVSTERSTTMGFCSMFAHHRVCCPPGGATDEAQTRKSLRASGSVLFGRNGDERAFLVGHFRESSTLLTASASSCFERGFMRNSLIPASFALSGVTTSLWPVQRMMGMSGRILRSFFAR